MVKRKQRKPWRETRPDLDELEAREIREGRYIFEQLRNQIEDDHPDEPRKKLVRNLSWEMDRLTPEERRKVMTAIAYDMFDELWEEEHGPQGDGDSSS